MKECALNLLENQKIKKIRTADFFNIIYNITMIGKIEESLKKLKNKDKAEILQRFFKTQKGQYGEGDKFLGIIVPLQRQVAKEYYKQIEIDDLIELLNSDIHEFRLTAVFILVYKFQKAENKERDKIYKFYLKNIERINNWDLVDLSAPNIIGEYLKDKDRGVLYKLADSDNLWRRRVAILSTFSFIRENDFKDALKISRILLNDEHDLINKAVGWMLREIGKRDLKTEEGFLLKYYKTMPRTTLRYAIERFSVDKRIFYLER